MPSIADYFITTDADRAGGEIRPRFAVRRARSSEVFADGWMSHVGLAVGSLLFEDGAVLGSQSELRAPLEIAAHGALLNFAESAEARLSETNGLLHLSFTDASSVPLRSEAHDFDVHEFSYSGDIPLLRPGMTFVGERGKPYVVGAEVGRGGTAAVFEVRSSGGRYAAKCLSPRRFPIESLIDRFGREVDNLRSIRHPNILAYHDSAYDGAGLILVTELAEMDLAEKMRQSHPTTGVAEGWIEALLQGLSEIHAHSMVHRDLSPKNVLFVNGSLKIGDFGVAKAAQNIDVTDDEARVQLGSLIYISSEQRTDPKSASPPDDIFAAGQLAYYLLTGIVPIGNPPPLTSRASVALPVSDVVERMRAFALEDRYKDGASALTAFQAARVTLPDEGVEPE